MNSKIVILFAILGVSLIIAQAMNQAEPGSIDREYNFEINSLDIILLILSFSVTYRSEEN